MALRRFRQCDRSLKDKIVFKSINNKQADFLGICLKSSDQLSYENKTTIYLDLFEITNE